MTMSAVIDNSKRTFGKSTMLVDCPHTGDDNYAAATGIDISSSDFDCTGKEMHALLITGTTGGAGGSGSIAVILEGGGAMTIPALCAAGDHKKVLENFRISKILKASSGTSYTGGRIFPIF